MKQQQIYFSPSVSPTYLPTRFPSNTLNDLHEESFIVQLENGQKLYIGKNELDVNGLPIYDIVKYTLSPDKTKILLFTQSVVTTFLLFYKDLETNKTTYISFGEEAVWSPNSRYIAFTKRLADIGNLDLYIFDTTTHKEAETIQAKNNNNISYSNLRWATTSDAVIADYETRDDTPYGNLIDQGEMTLKLK